MNYLVILTILIAVTHLQLPSCIVITRPIILELIITFKVTAIFIIYLILLKL